MKIKLLLVVSIVLSFVLVACSGEEKKTKPDYTVEEAVNDGHLVVQNLGENLDEVIRDGKMETKQLNKIFEFKKMADQGKEANVKITIFNKDGTYATNKLSFTGKKYVFENNYAGYQSSKGTFTCDYFNLMRGTAELQMCKNNEGKQLKRMTVLISEMSQFHNCSF
ncbi:hypothetical protein GCM10009001_24680 [Virgibacillus siamensis]|uniref:DUF4362 domain-containing protein n=1 Tax=Virgibacillus siamensis TaxID=480071 RepID=A0ABP3RAC0_9BACI